MRMTTALGVLVAVSGALAACGADKKSSGGDAPGSGGTDSGTGAGAGMGTAGGVGGGSGSGASAGRGGTGGVSGGSPGAGSGGMAGKAGSAGAGNAGAAGRAGCQRLDLEVGDTGEQGLKLLYRATIASNLKGLGFSAGYFYLRGSPVLGELSLLRVSLESDEVEVLGELPSSTTILVGDDLIWHEVGFPEVSTGELKTAPVSDFAAGTVLATTRTMLGLVADADNVYFSVTEPDEVYSVPRAGGEPKLLLEGASTRNLSPVGDYLYYFDVPALALKRIPTGGGDDETLLPAIDPGTAFADADGIHWYEFIDRRIVHLAFGDAASTIVVSEVIEQPFFMTVVDDELAWLHGVSCGGLSRPSATGMQEELVVNGFNQPNWIGANGQRLYLTDVESVYRLDR